MVKKNRHIPEVDVIKEWITKLPEKTIVLTEEVLAYEHVVRLEPSNSKAAGVEFRFSYYNTFGLYFGIGFAVEELPTSAELVIDICESLRQGRAREEVRELCGKVIRTWGQLKLSSKTLWDTGGSSWFSLIPFGTHRVVRYEPW